MDRHHLALHHRDDLGDFIDELFPRQRGGDDDEDEDKKPTPTKTGKLIREAAFHGGVTSVLIVRHRPQDNHPH